jgi:hypothetical protein
MLVSPMLMYLDKNSIAGGIYPKSGRVSPYPGGIGEG